MKTREMGAIPPSAILSRKGIARYGGVSRTGPLSPPPYAGLQGVSILFDFLADINVLSPGLAPDVIIKVMTSRTCSE